MFIDKFIREKLLRGVLQKHCFFAHFAGRLGFRLAWTRYSKFRLHRIGLKQGLDSLPVPKDVCEKTLFILGTGASINEYSAEQWDEVRANLSIGINYWVLHDFVPQYYMTELLGQWENMLHAICIREKDFQNANWIIKAHPASYAGFKSIRDGVRKLPDAIRKGWHVVCVLPLPGDWVETFRKSLQWLDGAGFFKKDPSPRYLAQSRGTIESAIILGIKMGIKKIVLCGVDLNNRRNCFFTDNSAYYEAKGLRIPDTGQKDEPHLTDRSFGRFIRVSEAIEQMQDVICNKRGIQIFIGSKSSQLYPQLPLYNWMNDAPKRM